MFDPAVRSQLRRDPAVRSIVREFRRLTADAAGVTRDAGRATLVACSGGADSTAVLLALAATPVPLRVAHVIHDIRPEPETRADAEHVRALASTLSIPFAEASVQVRAGRGNLEARARIARERALARLAAESACVFVATGHHADDVLETMLMRLMRGSGVRGIAGPHPARRLGGSGVFLLRPALSVSRAETERICELAGVTPRHDATNDDTRLLRNALRTNVLPTLKELSPGVERRAVRLAGHVRSLDAILRREAESRLGKGAFTSGMFHIDRRTLADSPPVVVGEVLRLAIAQLSGGSDLDRVGSAPLSAAVRAILAASGETRTFQWGNGGRLVLRVSRDRVELRAEGGYAREKDRARRTLRP